MFTHTSLHHAANTRNTRFKYLTMFFLGASCVVLMTQGFNITTNLNNALQYIGKIVISSDGTNQGSTGIILDGANGSAYFSGNVSVGHSGVSLDANGNISAGNISAFNHLSVNDKDVTSVDITSTGYTASINFLTEEGGTTRLFNEDGTAFRMTTENSVPIIFSINNGERMKINGDGNIGIGNSNPKGKLTVSNGGEISLYPNSGYSRMQISQDPAIYTGLEMGNLNLFGNSFSYIRSPEGSLFIHAGGNSLFSPGILVTTGGSVAIGAPAASAMLTVNGGIKPITKVSDPCADTTNYPAGTLFYRSNIDNGRYCFCGEDNSAVKMGTTSSCY